MNLFADETALIQRSQAGDTHAFGELVVCHQDYVYNLALRVIGNAAEAEDLAQDTFVRAWMGLANFRGQAQFRTWLYRIVTNLCYNRLPGLRRELTLLGDDCLDDLACDEALSVDPAAYLEAQEQNAVVQREIERLPESYRLLVTLRYQQNLSYEEIAAVTNLPLGTVKTGLFRAKERLRQSLMKETCLFFESQLLQEVVCAP